MQPPRTETIDGDARRSGGNPFLPIALVSALGAAGYLLVHRSGGTLGRLHRQNPRAPDVPVIGDPPSVRILPKSPGPFAGTVSPVAEDTGPIAIEVSAVVAPDPAATTRVARLEETRSAVDIVASSEEPGPLSELDATPDLGRV